MSGLFVIVKRPEGTCWLLSLQGKSMRDCQHDISWQIQGGSKREEFEIAPWNPIEGAFVTVDGRAFNPDQGPYTEIAWRTFTAALPSW